MYEKFAELIEKRGVTTYQVSKATGIPTATFSAWKQGKYNFRDIFFEQQKKSGAHA